MRPEHLKVSHLSEIRWMSGCGVGWWGRVGLGWVCRWGSWPSKLRADSHLCTGCWGVSSPPLASRVEGEESGGGGGKGELRGGPLGRGRGRGKWLEKENKENSVSK